MPKVSLILPCLNEAATIGECIEKANKAFAKNGIDGEVIVVDCYSSDGSAEIAKKLGAKVVQDRRRGYGLAYQLGVKNSSGEWLIKADSDGTYDLNDIPRFLEELKKGNDYVIGNRFRGGIEPGAMPPLHRYLGNPALTWMQNAMFGTKMGDAHCGFRAFTRSAFNRMQLKSRGMEIASELDIKAAKIGLKVSEIPIRYYPRKAPSKLNTFRDGWRNLRFMLLFSPDHLFVLPAVILLGLGLFMAGLGIESLDFLLPNILPPDANLQVLAMIMGGFLFLLGFQILIFGISAKSYAVVEGYEKHDWLYAFVNRYFDLEKLLFLGLVIIAGTAFFGLNTLLHWLEHGIRSVHELKNAVIVLVIGLVGVQIIFNAFFLSLIGIKKRD